MSPDSPRINPVAGVSTLDLASELASSRQHKPWQSGLYSKLLLKVHSNLLGLT